MMHLKKITRVASALLACCCVNVNAQEKAPPNVLLIAIDDLNDWIGCMGGHPQAQTPNMDRLAARGVLFDNAHCQSPVCNPSRASMMTSLYPSTTGIYTPHVPQYAPQKWFDLYPLETLQLPKVVANDLKDISEYAVNTYVVLYTDHGFHQGEKERFAKRSLWEDGTRTPMIIAGPGIVEGSVCSKPAQLLDIYPTLLELTGLKADAKLEGNSLVPLLKNPQADWPHRARTSFGPGNYSIVSEAYRYICYNDGSEEFYDRSKDTHEWNNVITNPEYAAVIKKHQAQVPQQRHEILSQNSTGHKSFEASEAVSRGEPIPADKPVKKNRKK
jgi:arylsulfatase A-like enzyme